MLKINLSVGDGLVVATSDHVTTSHKVDSDLKLNSIIRPHFAARRRGWQKKPAITSAGPSREIDGRAALTELEKQLVKWRNLFRDS